MIAETGKKKFNFVNRAWSYLVFRYMDSAATISNFLKLFNNLTLACEVFKPVNVDVFLLPPATNWGKVIFSQASVILSSEG